MGSYYDNVIKTFKSDINNFLFTRLPGDCTVADLDKLAIEIHNIVVSKWAGKENITTWRYTRN